MAEEQGAGGGALEGSGTARSLEPTRDPRVTLPDLVEVLLNKGVYLNLDLIIAVADIPLIGINLRATIAGVETMLEYGMMRNWDERTRRWVRQSTKVPLARDEDIAARMSGGHYTADDYGLWRPGTIYLTTHRLIVYRREPPDILWQTSLADIADLELHTERTIGGEERTRLHIMTAGGVRSVISAREPERLHEMLRHRTGKSGESATPRPRPRDQALAEGRMWFREEHFGHPVWRGGTGRLDAKSGLTWKGALDSRPAVRLAPDEITSATLRTGHTPLSDTILLVRSQGGDVSLAADEPEQWAGLILQMLESGAKTHIDAGAHP